MPTNDKICSRDNRRNHDQPTHQSTSATFILFRNYKQRDANPHASSDGENDEDVPCDGQHELKMPDRGRHQKPESVPLPRLVANWQRLGLLLGGFGHSKEL
jgi:hypothetical protein